MSFAAHELPTFTLKGSICKTYSISIIPGHEQSKILPRLTGGEILEQMIKTEWCGLPETESQQGNFSRYKPGPYGHIRKQKNGKSNGDKDG